jgi:hypothetical protein
MLFVLGDLLTTTLFLNQGGLEANPFFEMLILSGEQGRFLIVIIKLTVFVNLMMIMYILLKTNFLKLYKFLVYTTESMSIFVVISNLFVFFTDKNIFQLIGLF